MLEVRPCAPAVHKLGEGMHYLILVVIAIFMSMYLSLGFMRLT